MTLPAAAAGRIAPVAGGVLIRNSEGRVMGAVGVSGDHPEKDEACAVFGVKGTCLMADVG